MNLFPTSLMGGRRESAAVSLASVPITEERDAPRLSQRACLRADLDRRYADWGSTTLLPRRARLLCALMNPGFQAVFMYRVGRAFHLRGWKVPAWATQMLSLWLTSADIAPSSDIGPGMIVTHPVGVTVWARIGANVRLNGNVMLGTMDGERSVVVGDDVSFGHGSTTLGRVTIGDDANVGAMTLVMKDVPAGHTAVGIPARLLPPKDA